MTKELKKHFDELVVEFNTIQNKLTDNTRVFSMLRIGAFPTQGSIRYGNGYSIEHEVSLKHELLCQYIRGFISDFKSTTKLYQYFVRENLWPLKVFDLKTDLFSIPSISKNVVSGFLVRNFELNGNAFVCTPSSVEQTLSELDDFLAREHIVYTSILALHGPSGLLDEVKLTEDVILRKANFSVARLFGMCYSDWDNHYMEMFEGDYILEIKFNIPKTRLHQINTIENRAFDQWFHVPLLTKTGNVEMGKRIRISSDWPLIHSGAINIPWALPNLYNRHYESGYLFDREDVGRLQSISDLVSSVDFENLDDRIKYSIERLRKAKACKDINDRVVELALALEYLINTTNSEVTLQLALKSVKLLYDNNTSEELYRSIKTFYNLRSKVVHGNSKLGDDPNIAKIIDTMESTIQNMILCMIELNKTYSEKDINEALARALFISLPLKDILNDN